MRRWRACVAPLSGWVHLAPSLVGFWVCASRVAHFRHSPGDVCAGALLGGGIAAVTFVRCAAAWAEPAVYAARALAGHGGGDDDNGNGNGNGNGDTVRGWQSDMEAEVVGLAVETSSSSSSMGVAALTTGQAQHVQQL